MVARWEQGSVILVDFDPSLGHESKKQQPALVVSNDQFNERSSLVLVCPITSADNGYPLHISIGSTLTGVSGFACVEQIRTLDLAHRDAITVGRVSENVVAAVTHLVALMVKM